LSGVHSCVGIHFFEDLFVAGHLECYTLFKSIVKRRTIYLCCVTAFWS